MLCLVLDEAVLVREWFKLTTLRRLCSMASIHGQLKGRSLLFFFSRACIDEVRCVECRLLLKLQQTKHWWNAKHEVSRRGRSSLSFSRVCNEMRSVKCLPSTEANFLVLFHQSMHWANAKCEIHASADHASVKCNLWSINWQRGGTSVFLLQHRMHWWSLEASWMRVGASKMRLWSVLEHLWASWGRFRGVLEASWGRLAAPVERHGGALELLIDF